MYKWIGWKLESQYLKLEFAFSLFLKIVFSNLGKTHYNFKKKIHPLRGRGTGVASEAGASPEIRGWLNEIVSISKIEKASQFKGKKILM